MLLTSQVFLGMVKGLGRYRDEGKPFVAWLYGIAQKQIAFFQRGQSRSPSPVDLDAAAELAAQSSGPDATAEQRELRAGIARALGKVPEGQREVIMLRYILSLSLAETAAVQARRHSFLVIPGVEVNTEDGHMLVFGIDRYVYGMHRMRDLSTLVEKAGGVIVAAHPYRRLMPFYPADDELWSLALERALG